jgi:sialate O-acetylesterase
MLRKAPLFRLLFSLSFAVPCAGLHAEVRLPHVLGDNMVLQRDAPIHIWGWAQPGEAISVALQGGAGKAAKHLEGKATADKLGQWSVYLPAQPAGGPYDLAVQGSGGTTTLHDVMIGDLWIASGQSNMEMPLAGFGASTPVKDGDKEIAAATHPELRLMVVPKTGSAFPQDDVNATWTQCTPETAKNFSAAAYFFGREIAAKEHVTIGLVDTTWGGTPAEAWTSFDAFGKNPALAGHSGAASSPTRPPTRQLPPRTSGRTTSASPPVSSRCRMASIPIPIRTGRPASTTA